MAKRIVRIWIIYYKNTVKLHHIYKGNNINVEKETKKTNKEKTTVLNFL